MPARGSRLNDEAGNSQCHEKDSAARLSLRASAKGTSTPATPAARSCAQSRRDRSTWVRSAVSVGAGNITTRSLLPLPSRT